MKRKTGSRAVRAVEPEFAEIELKRPETPLVAELAGDLRLHIADAEGARLAAELIGALGDCASREEAQP